MQEYTYSLKDGLKGPFAANDPVYDTQGRELGRVSRSITSLGVSKRFGAIEAQFTNRFGPWGWMVRR